MRIILYSGKGGVGKPSVTAVTSLQSAEFGYNTMAFSTDIVHSLSDWCDVSLEPTLKKILETCGVREHDDPASLFVSMGIGRYSKYCQRRCSRQWGGNNRIGNLSSRVTAREKLSTQKLR